MANVTNTQVNVKPHVQAMSTITGLNDKIAEIEASIGSADDDIEALDWRLDTAESDIDALETAVADRYTKAETDSAIASAISSVYRYKGSVADYAHLPSSGQIVGDVYNVEDTGDNYAWAGSAWDKLAGTVDLSSYFNKSNDDADDILEWSSHLFMTSAERTKLWQQSGVNTGDQEASDFDIKDLADSTSLRATWSGKQDAIADLSNIRSRAEGSIQAADATFVSNTVSEAAATGVVTVTAADNVTVATAETNNKSAIAALGTAHNNLVSRVAAIEEGDDEKTKFFTISFSGTEHTYSHEFITADSFVNYNFDKDPEGYVEFTVQAGKIGIKSSATESNLTIKVSVTKNPGSFIALTADA